MRTPEAMEWLLRAEKRSVSQKQIAALSRHKQTLAHRLLAKKPPIVPGCHLVLEKLSKHYQLALVSSSRRKNVALFLKASKTRRFFKPIMSGEDLTHSKPSPFLYKGVLRQLGLKAGQVLVVEDSLQGVRAAARAHLRVLAVRGSSPEKRLRQAGAFRVINDVRELKNA
jgi:HAD superfamily hydrolase (TIGR01509 family)